MSRAREMVRKHWVVYEALRSRRRGLTVAALVEQAGASRATIYRYLELLEQVGIPILKERVNGEVRYRLMEQGPAACTLCSDDLAAVALAREALQPLEGTQLVARLDQLLHRAARTASAPAWVSVVQSATEHDKGALRAIDLAIRDGHRLSFGYAPGDGTAPVRRLVDPVAVRVVRSQPYLVAFDLHREDWRIFKLTRITDELGFEGPARPRPEYDEQALFVHSLGIWTGDPHDVMIRLSPTVAQRVREYPLAREQTVTMDESGSAVVRARVAGLAEALRWVLGWGAQAQVLAPVELRQAVAGELAAAAAHYVDKVSHDRATAVVQDDPDGQALGCAERTTGD